MAPAFWRISGGGFNLSKTPAFGAASAIMADVLVDGVWFNEMTFFVEGAVEGALDEVAAVVEAFNDMTFVEDVAAVCAAEGDSVDFNEITFDEDVEVAEVEIEAELFFKEIIFGAAAGLDDD